MELKGPFAFFKNGVFAKVLKDILAIEDKFPDQETFLQPRGGTVPTGLRDHPPTREAPIPIYLSTTEDLSHVSYVGEIVCWRDTRDMPERKRVSADVLIRKHQPDEKGFRLSGRYPEVNLLKLRHLQRLTTPISVAELVKLSDGVRLSTHRTTSGGWAYVYPLSDERLAAAL